MVLLPLGLGSTVLLGVFVLLVTYLGFRRRHSSKYPPCPIRPWPILGHLPLIEEDPRKQFAKFREKCGDIFSLYFGPQHVVIFNGYSLSKEALIKRGDEFSERTTVFVDVITQCQNKGLGGSNGEAWRQNRTLSQNVMRNLGVGKNTLAHKVQEEVDHYIEFLDNLQGQPKNVHLAHQFCMANIICSIIIGKRFDYGDAMLQRILTLLGETMHFLKGTAILNYFSCLRFVPGDPFKSKAITKCLFEFFDVFAHVYIKENEDCQGEADNFIAAYMQKMKKNDSSYLDKSNLLKCILDLFSAGMETSATTLSWLMLYMLNYPEIQEKVFKEIQDEIGLEKTPTMQDKVKLPYLSAVIMETQRIANIVPLLLPRTLARETTLGGYILPKGVQILVNMDSILADKAIWGEDVNEFRPERFIGKDGSLIIPEQFIPFSHGRRVCLGEGVAKVELYLFVANILQKFELLPADKNKIPPINGHFGIVHSPEPFQLRFVRRK